MRSAVLAGLIACLWACGEKPIDLPVSAAVETFVEGGLIDGANGLLMGPDGNLYVASVISPGIFVIDPQDGHVLDRRGPAQGVHNPDDVAFAPDGTLCWTDILDGTVGCRAPDDTVVTAARLTPGVNPITFADDGRLFVSQCFFDDKLYEIDPRGEGEPRLIRGDLGPGCGLNGMDIGPDGLLYGPRWFKGEVVSVNVDTGELTTIATGFGAPAAVKFDAKGRLHVLDTLKGEVRRIDGEAQTLVATLTPGMDNLAFAPDDRLFVTSFVDGYVAEVVAPTDIRVVVPGGVSMPGGIGVRGNTLLVGDFFSLRKYDLSTGKQTGIERDVLGVSDLGTVLSLHIDGDVLVLSSWNDRTIRLWDDAKDKRVALFEHVGRPIDALRFAGEIVFTEYDAGAVVSFAPSDLESTTMRYQSADLPAGLAVDGGDLYLTENRSGRLLQLARNGEWLATPIQVATGFNAPEGVLVRNGIAYVVETGADDGTLAAVAIRDGRVERFADGLAVGSPALGDVPSTLIFSGIAADSAGRLYVGGERDNIIQRITVAQ